MVQMNLTHPHRAHNAKCLAEPIPISNGGLAVKFWGRAHFCNTTRLGICTIVQRSQRHFNVNKNPGAMYKTIFLHQRTLIQIRCSDEYGSKL